MTILERIKCKIEELFYHQNRDVEGMFASNGIVIGILVATVIAFILFIIEELFSGVPNLGAFSTIFALLATAQIYKSLKLGTTKENLDIIIPEIILFMIFFIGQIFICTLR